MVICGSYLNRFQGALNKFVWSLSDKAQNVFVRRYWYGDSVGEIARELRMRENAVSVRLNRTRNSLKAYLKKEGYQYEV